VSQSGGEAKKNLEMMKGSKRAFKRIDVPAERRRGSSSQQCDWEVTECETRGSPRESGWRRQGTVVRAGDDNYRRGKISSKAKGGKEKEKGEERMEHFSSLKGTGGSIQPERTFQGKRK